MGVDASSIGGVGTGNSIPTSFDYYHNLGFFSKDDEDRFSEDGIDSVEQFIRKIVGDDVKLLYTYGYDESELFANVDKYISAMAKIGIIVNREDICPWNMAFFS
jgi:hypothetical protein